MTLEQGDVGQFDVMVGEERVATRSKAFWARLLSGGWPDPAEVVDTLRQHQAAS